MKPENLNENMTRDIGELTPEELDGVSGGGTLVEVVAVVGTAVAAGYVYRQTQDPLAGTIKAVASQYGG